MQQHGASRTGAADCRNTPDQVPTPDLVVTALYEGHRDALRTFVRRRCGCRQDADDLVGEVFAQAMAASAKGHTIEAGWLYTVARRRLVDRWRRSGRVHRAEREGDHTADPGAALDARALIRGLPERQRRALWLRYWCDLTVAEVARELQLSADAAESLLARARRNARRHALADGVSTAA